jgi:hypothetical protein
LEQPHGNVVKGLIEAQELDRFKNEISSQVLPTSEIAKLAATLANGRSIDSQSLSVIATQAIELWEKCEEIRKRKIDRLALYARAEAMKVAREKLPRPKTFPASLDDVLRCVMPNKKRPEDRAKCHREYVRQRFRPQDGQIPTEDDVANCIAHDKEKGFPEGVYDLVADDFRQWLSQYESNNRRIRAQTGAAALKKKRQKNAKT